MKLISLLGGRKVFISLVLLIAGIAVAMVKGDIPPNLLSLLQVILGAYIVGNGVTHVSAAVKGKQQEPQPDNSAPVVAALERVEEQNKLIIEANSLVQQGLSAILKLAGGARQ